MLNATVIIPIVESNTEYELLERAINSVAEQKVLPKELLIVHTSGCDLKKIKSLTLPKNVTVNFLENTSKDTSYQGQINFAITKIETEFFSVLEYDDYYTNFYFDDVKAYIEKFKDVSSFLPLSIDITNENKFVKYSNEVAFFRDATEDLGLVSQQALLKGYFFNFSGGFFKKADFLDIKGLKTKLKYSNIFEYFLRSCNNDQIIKVIPFVGYVHCINREGSYTDMLSKDTMLTKQEFDFWFEKAKREYYFLDDRDVKYVPTTV